MSSKRCSRGADSQRLEAPAADKIVALDLDG